VPGAEADFNRLIVPGAEADFNRLIVSGAAGSEGSW